MSFNSTIPILPFDVILLVIEEAAANNDFTSLHSLSLLCHTFLLPCRKHIFHTFWAGGNFLEGLRLLCERFYRLLQSSPHIITLVREVNLVLTDMDLDYIKNPGNLPRIIRMLSGLRTFKMKFNYRVGGPGDWTKLGSELKETLAWLFTSSRLTSLHLRRITHFPMSLLAKASSSLTDVAIRSVYIDTCEDVDETERLLSAANVEDRNQDDIPVRAKLRTCRISPLSQLSFLLPGISPVPALAWDFSELRELTIKVRSIHDTDVIQKIISKASGSLRKFGFSVSAPVAQSFFSLVKLPPTPFLHVLSIRAPEHSLPETLSFLKTEFPHNKISTLELRIHSLEFHKDNWADIRSRREWKDLDALLCSSDSDNFTFIRRVSLELEGDWYGEAFLMESIMAQELLEEFPKLSQAQSIDFCIRMEFEE